jgi:invasion protein IalB
MKRSVVWVLGAGLFAAAAAALYFFEGRPATGELLALIRGEPRVARGFIGTVDFGRWRLICIPGTRSLGGLLASVAPDEGDADEKAASANACRVNQEVPARAGQMPIAANFSLAGPRRQPAITLRLPATAHPGDAIELRADDLAPMRVTVGNCETGECMATGDLGEEDWAHVRAARSLKLTLPAADGQRTIDLPVQGLAAAVTAMGRAQIPPTR